MNPGATANPLASISSVAVAFSRSPRDIGHVSGRRGAVVDRAVTDNHVVAGCLGEAKAGQKNKQRW